MKLINSTRIPDSVLRRVLLSAAKSIGGTRTGSVVVAVSQGQRSNASGTAWECDWVRWNGRRRTMTDGGAFRIRLPMPHPACDILLQSEGFWDIARHEWGHIRDYQNGGRRRLAFSKAGSSGRRPGHDSRPEEIRVERYSRVADRIRKRDAEWAAEEILELAVEMEGARAS